MAWSFNICIVGRTTYSMENINSSAKLATYLMNDILFEFIYVSLAFFAVCKASVLSLHSQVINNVSQVC